MTETATEAKVVPSPSSSSSSSSSLYRRLSGLGEASSGTVTKTLNKWLREGKSVKKYEIENYVKQLRKYKRYNQALELMEWLESKGTNLSYSDYAIRLDLLSKTKGITEAEKYFTSLSEPAKNHLTYGALLNSYCVVKMPDKAMALLDKMKELNFASTSLVYNNLMSLYMRLHQPEKVPLLFQEMKAKKISADAFTYNVLMNSYASLKDIEAVERVVEEMKEEGNVCCNWTTYSNLAAIYVEAGNFDKADVALKGLEKIINHRDRQAFHFLISLYARTHNLAEVKRVWESLKSAFPKTTNLSYLVMLQALAKLGDFNALGKYFEEWELGCTSYDVRLVNVLISAYLRRDMIEEAKSLYESAVVKGPGPNFRTLEMFIEFHLKNDQIDLAMKHFETAVSKAKDDEWRPSQEKVRAFLKHFEESKDVDGAEEFYKKLKKVNYLDLEVYSSLLRTYMAAGKTEPLMRQRMKLDEIEMNSQTKELLQRVCPEGNWVIILPPPLPVGYKWRERVEMEGLGWSGEKKMKARPKLTLENYIDFHENPQNCDILTIHQLNQIIAMHGFIKLHNRPKKELMDAMNSIDVLLPPLRSTLKENVSSCALLTLEQVKEDLAKLEWQECPVQSIETLKSVKENLLADDPHVICGSSTSNPGYFQRSIVGFDQGKAKRPRSRSRKRKRKNMKTVLAASPAVAATTVDVFADDAAATTLDVFREDAAPSSFLSLGF